MNKKLILLSFALSSVAFVGSSSFGRADEAQTQDQTSSTESMDSSQQQGGVASEESIAKSGDSAKSETSASKESDKKEKMMLQSSVAPHSVMIHTALQSAADQIKGLRAQFDISQAAPSSESFQYYKAYEKEVNEDVSNAMTYQQKLQGSIKKFPEVAQSDEYRSWNTSLTEVKQLSKDWRSKASKQEYWKNREQVKSDLDSFEKRLNTAIDKTKSFNSERLDVSAFG